MALVIRDTNTIPPERFHYPVAQTEMDIYAPNYNSLYGMIVQHCQANNISPPGEQAVIDWLCVNLSLPCYDSGDRQPLINRWTMGTPGELPSSCCSKPAAPVQIEGM